VASIVAKMREISKIDRTVADEVRRALVETLFTSSTSLGAGAVTGAAVSATIALATGDPWLGGAAIAIAVTGAIRLAYAVLFHAGPESDAAQSARSETMYELGAWLYAMLIGLLTFLTLTHTDRPILQLLAATMSTGYAGGICGRNAGRPVIAIGQLALASAPMTVALILGGDPLRWVLAALNIVFMFGMVDITLQTYSAVLKAMSATREQKLLTDRFERLARFDAMTGLENRGAFQERLQAELGGRRAARRHLGRSRQVQGDQRFAGSSHRRPGPVHGRAPARDDRRGARLRRPLRRRRIRPPRRRFEAGLCRGSGARGDARVAGAGRYRRRLDPGHRIDRRRGGARPRQGIRDPAPACRHGPLSRQGERTERLLPVPAGDGGGVPGAARARELVAHRHPE
jgi:hypothetical protein